MPSNHTIPTHSPNYLIVLAGPTAVGKTEASIRLARELDTEIVSADSRQFFREMTIGTAKPSPEEMDGIPHHFINSHSITENYSVGDFERDALLTLEEIFSRKQVAILVGGSGLYVKILCDGMDEIPDVTPGIREALIEQFEKEGLRPLLAQLEALDPVYYNQVDSFNSQRIMRALEVCLSTGQPFSSFRKNGRIVRPFKVVKIVLERDRDELYDRINRRMDLMLEQGLVEEVKSLWSYRQHNALQTVGYSEVFDFLDGQYDEAEMVRLLKRNSRRYAKRQLTWFKRDKDFIWFNAKEYEAVRAYVREQTGL